jgi:hypothetical protein
MPDTLKNQKEYPQPSSQKPGCGFPLLRLVGLFSLASGALLFTGSATPQGITLTGFGGGITNPLGEYVITQNNMAAAGVVLASDLVSAGSLTKAGPGTLIMALPLSAALPSQEAPSLPLPRGLDSEAGWYMPTLQNHN